MNIIEILQKKRDREELSKEEISYFVNSYTKDIIPDYQASAFLMACFINGLSKKETYYLTEAMLYSGDVVDLSKIEGIKVDKHSTGGVGDKPSLIIAPICAACDVPVPMVSGRGLGHSGGTLDKLEAIPGFNVNLDLQTYKEIIADLGFCLIGQTKEMAPADKKIYALRDVTSTVENRSLISASIMSKKLAEGIDALVLDVKVGEGAFMKTLSQAEALAKLLIDIGTKMDKQVVALITSMNQPLGAYVGNALEVIESVNLLKGEVIETNKDLFDLSISLAAHMIKLGKKAKSLTQAKKLALQTIENLSAFTKFKDLVRRQGGNPDSLDDFSLLPTANSIYKITAQKSGYLSKCNAFTIGQGAVELGAGRKTIDSKIDPAVGVVLNKKQGQKVNKGDLLFEIHYNDQKALDASLPYFERSCTITSRKPAKEPLIRKTLGE